MNPYGIYQKEDQLLPSIKKNFLVIFILAEILDIRQLIVESLKGKTMKET
jgi:hypothetical protein